MCMYKYVSTIVSVIMNKIYPICVLIFLCTSQSLYLSSQTTFNRLVCFNKKWSSRADIVYIYIFINYFRIVFEYLKLHILGLIITQKTMLTLLLPSPLFFMIFICPNFFIICTQLRML